MLKSQLRIDYINKRKLLSNDYVERNSITIANNILKLPIWKFSFYHVFLSIEKNKEVDTTPLLSVLNGKDKNIIVPKIISKSSLKNFLLTDNTVLKPNALRIPEPVDGIEIDEAKIDVVFIPLLAFDKNGNRVGYGKGYYDHFLAKCRPDIIKVGLSFFEASENIEDTGEHDVALDYCITPNTTYRF